MASMGLPSINLQDSPDVPDIGEEERYEAELSHRIHARQDAVIDRFVELIADQCYRKDNNPLAEMHTLLSGPQGASIGDVYDARQYAAVGTPSDAALATLVRFLYAQANLAIADEVRGELSGIAF